MKSHSKIKLDSLLALVLSSFFGLGMVLKSYIQGNPKYLNASQSGLQNYIFGQASYIMKSDLKLIVLISLVSFFLLVWFYQPLKIFIFDEEFACSLGLRKNFYNGLILIMTTLMIAVGLKAVGSILISSMLIAPAFCGLNWSQRFDRVLLIAGLVGGSSAFIGSLMSSIIKNMPTGPAIILVMSGIALVAIIFTQARLKKS
ncbi:metal ABC transporter permease [Enterococcus faecalis]|uniref:metal ABC transporter permease n=1 Tax=Enterococcus faecalis TaxID=1351 RepID=UPI0011433303|nr:iron chelate uptake ABC transporter family permease subunit [Enterococcus faecalis]NSW10284.1 metal ABC transporter permease [Enterococcus faecalis]TQB30343.1 metal ABC transporter permease [Enterococcus faecalis]